MDPLSLAASIIAVVGAGAQTAKLLKRISTAKKAPVLAVALNNEVSDLRMTVQVIQELFWTPETVPSQKIRGLALSSEITDSINNCLNQANRSVLELEQLLNPLLVSTSTSRTTLAKTFVYWMKEETRLYRLRQNLYNVRLSLNTVLGIADLSTSIRLQGMAYDLRTNIIELHRNHEQLAHSQTLNAVKMDTSVARIAEMIFCQQLKSDKSGSNSLGETANSTLALESKGLSTDHQDQIITVVAPPIISTKLYKRCSCRYRQDRTWRSPNAFNQAAGMIFATYSGIPNLRPQCKVQSCPNSGQRKVSAIYFFPTWFLSWAVGVGIVMSEQGLDYNLRWTHCVSYSSAIFLYAYQGDTSNVKMLLRNKSGSPFDMAIEMQKTLLTVAASRGHGEICEVLLHAGADPLAVDYKDRSAVDIAWEAQLTRRTTAASLSCLLPFSSSRSYAEKFRLGLLHRTILQIGRLDLKTLLENVLISEINETDIDGQTPLYWAALRGDYEAVSLLIEAGADVNSQNKLGARILTAAITSSNTCCIQTIMKTPGCDINYTQLDGYTLLHLSCRHRVEVGVVKTLIQRGADLNARTHLGHTPLMIATFNQRSAICNYIINHVSLEDLDIQGNDGACSLHYAIMAGDHQTVRQLLEHGVNHCLKTRHGETVLHFAAQRNGDETMISILELFDLEGIDAEGKNRDGLTALNIAEKQHAGNVTWLQKFRSLVQNALLGSSGQDLRSNLFEDALEYQYV